MALRPAVLAAFALMTCAWAAYARAPESADLWNGAEINWRDARSGIYEATKTKRPVIMVFHATWCGVCKHFRAVFRDPAVVAASRDFVMILVDVDREKELNSEFSPGGSYVPRTMFVDPEGNVSDKLVGTDPQYPHSINVDKPDELLALMKKAHQIFDVPPPASTAATPMDSRT